MQFEKSTNSFETRSIGYYWTMISFYELVDKFS